MTENDARFEFRCWARHFGVVDTRLRRLSPCHDISESEDFYIVASVADDFNIKIRNGRLEIKELIETRDGLERWKPRKTCPFPLTAAVLEDAVLPRLGVEPQEPGVLSCDADRFLEEFVLSRPGLAVAAVFKRRFAFTVESCMSELDEVWINGAGLHSVAVESTDPAAVLIAKRTLGLDNAENVSYPQAIKRVIGMVPLRTPY